MCCVGVCVCVCVCSVCYMHSTSFTIFGQRAASSSLAPAMSVHISHSTPHPFSSILPPLAYAAVVTHAQRQFRFQFRMLSMKRQRQKKRKRNATQKKNKQKLLSKFKQRFVLLPLYVDSLGLRPHRPTDPPTPLPTLSFFPFLFFACAAYVP